MFARLKSSSDGERIYVQIVVNERVPDLICGKRLVSRQRVIATLGRVEHLDDMERGFRVEELTTALVGVQATRATKRRRHAVQATAD